MGRVINLQLGCPPLATIMTRDYVYTFCTRKITLQALAKKLFITTILYDSFITIDGKKNAYISRFGSHD